MRKDHTEKNYSGYTFEDFLQDDFFISSTNNPTGESIAFWDEFLKENKINAEEFESAKQFILEIIKNSYDDCITDSELSVLGECIDVSIRKKKNTLKKIHRYFAYAAACIIIAILTIPYFTKDHEGDIVSFALENKTDDSRPEVRIVLSDREMLLLSDQESDIVYDSTGIKIAENNILRKGSAEYNQLIVPKGKRSRLTLADGTTLYVNSGTRVVYPVEFTDNKREIYVDGEIFINVTPDVKRRFIVKTKDISVQVLGTTFNVMAYEVDRDKQIVLVKGSVKVLDSKERTVTLKPSQMYETDSYKTIVKDVDVTRYTSWVDGLYFFESENLEVLLTRLSRYYGTDIIFTEDVAGLKCSGKMDLKDNLKDILEGLSFSFPIKVKYENGKYNITKSI